ncbi:MAG: hypothetical protein M3442_11880 [Chloroflexota bacterium]|nr:hypothetical protein [Chloroflexota bacterium]
MEKGTRGETAIEITTPQPPPYWALLERALLDAQAAACEAFYARYFDERGYLLCVPRWSGDDGPDDAAENLLNWPMLHALGAPDRILALYKQGWEGHLRQYTEAKTVDVPMGRDGMYYKEFHACFDWFHHGEALNPFVLQGLSDPRDPALIRRMRRFAEMYMGEDAHVPNYDPQHRLIRSFFNGSRGPLMRQANAVDWAGDPIEVAGRFKAGHGEGSYEEMLEHFRDYTDTVGDHPINLGATTLALSAYALTGEPKYRDWILEYVDAWVERTEANGGLLPTNIGLDGTIGGEYGWYGGCYGWSFTVDVVPYTGEKAHRAAWQQRCFYGFANALLLTGDPRYLALWRRMLDLVNSNAKVVDGQTLYPHMHGADGWYDFTPLPFAPGALELYYWTLDRSVLDLLPERPRWIAFLDGDDALYPEDALRRDLAELRRRMALVRADDKSPDCTMSDDTHRMLPTITERLTQLMLGGLPTGRVGYPLHCRLRYFDPVRRRAGLPEDVAALVEGMTESAVTVTLVNLSPVHARTVVVQGGAYAEHQIERVTSGAASTTSGAASTNQASAGVPVDQPHFAVHIAPGAGERLVIHMRRYANPPTLSPPWVE